MGNRHPSSGGEIWDEVGPRAKSAMLRNEGTYDEALLLIMERNGYPEETYYTFSYSPVPNDDGGTGGIICANTDDTQRDHWRAPAAALRELAARTADARTSTDACRLSAAGFGKPIPRDLPFALIYLVDADWRRLCWPGRPASSRGIRRLLKSSLWTPTPSGRFAEVVRTTRPCLIADLASWSDDVTRRGVAPAAGTGGGPADRAVWADRPSRDSGGRPEPVPAV